LDQLGLREQGMVIEVAPEIPKAMGMGGSAALAVAIIRALDTNFKLGLSDEDVRELSFKSENIIHGRASGIDNTVATYGRLILFQKDNPPLATTLNLAGDIPIVIGISGVESMTSKMILRIRKAREKHPEWYDDIFARMNELSLASGEAIESGNLARLGHLMNLNHGYLNTLSVSCPQVEELIDIARNNGALGAKITGGGGGGAMIALCGSEDAQKNIREKMYDAGYDALATNIKASAIDD
ncbi:MAG TPA: mevalonate kinase, partial [Fodinibius sp.]|nr:mevalonate kinase [Fodinibius sp.]